MSGPPKAARAFSPPRSCLRRHPRPRHRPPRGGGLRRARRRSGGGNRALPPPQPRFGRGASAPLYRCRAAARLGPYPARSRQPHAGHCPLSPSRPPMTRFDRAADEAFRRPAAFAGARPPALPHHPDRPVLRRAQATVDALDPRPRGGQTPHRALRPAGSGSGRHARLTIGAGHYAPPLSPSRYTILASEALMNTANFLKAPLPEPVDLPDLDFEGPKRFSTASSAGWASTGACWKRPKTPACRCWSGCGSCRSRPPISTSSTPSAWRACANWRGGQHHARRRRADPGRTAGADRRDARKLMAAQQARLDACARDGAEGISPS
jgi:hypothetical protein